MVGVAAHDTDANMEAFVSRHGLEGMPHIADDDTAVWDRYGIAYQPAWVFVTPAGEVEVVAGALHGDGLTSRLDTLVDG